MPRKPTSIAIRGANVSAARRLAALTQAEVAARAGITLSNMKRIEQRETVGVFPSTLRSLAQALGVTTNALSKGGIASASNELAAAAEMTVPAVLAWLDRQRLDVVGEVLEHAGSILDLAASARGRRTRLGGSGASPSKRKVK